MKTKNLTPYFFLAPFFVTYIVFKLYPQLYSVILCMYDYRFGGDSTFVGLQNFKDAFQDALYWKSLKNTIVLWLATLPIQLFLAFLIASALIGMTPKRRGILSGIYYLPVVTNVVAVTLVFQLLFDENFGLINYLGSSIGFQKVPWLTSSAWAPISTAILIIWKGLGYYVVYILAALMGVDQSLYEYAKIEGANFWQKGFYITIPCIMPILLYLVITGTISGWNIFMEPFLLFEKGGGPENSTLTAAIYVYQEGFRNLRYGYASAISLTVAFITTIFAILQFRFFNSGTQEA